MVGASAQFTTERRYQFPLPALAPTPPRNKVYSNAPAIAGAPSVKTPADERLGSSTCTTAMPSPVVNAPAPPAFLTNSLVAPAALTDVPSTTSTSERELAPPSLSTVSLRTRPPFAKNVPPPLDPGVCPPEISRTSPGTGLTCKSMVPELVNRLVPRIWPCTGPPSDI